MRTSSSCFLSASIIFLFAFATSAFSQTLERQFIGSAGSVMMSGGVVLKTSIGEPIVGKRGNGNQIISQGFFTGAPDVDVIYLSAPTPALNAIGIYPNPSDGNIILNGNTAAIHSVEIYNLTGQKIYSEVYSPGNISIGQLPAGLYLIHFLNTNNQIISSSKFIKVSE